MITSFRASGQQKKGLVGGALNYWDSFRVMVVGQTKHFDLSELLSYNGASWFHLICSSIVSFFFQAFLYFKRSTVLFGGLVGLQSVYLI